MFTAQPVFVLLNTNILLFVYQAPKHTIYSVFNKIINFTDNIKYLRKVTLYVEDIILKSERNN